MAIQYNTYWKIYSREYKQYDISYGLLAYSVNSILNINSFKFLYSLVLLSKCCVI